MCSKCHILSFLSFLPFSSSNEFGYVRKQSLTNDINEITDADPTNTYNFRVCARETLHSAPHQRERKFSGAHVWSGGGGGCNFRFFFGK
jgi:hypothetical protein